MRLLRYIFLVFLQFWLVSVMAQQLRFDRFDLSSGLSQSNINCMEFDDMGNIWLGTLDGVNRYNGYQFDVFKPNRSDDKHIVGNYIVSMGTGLNGDMWFVTRGGGLNHFNAERQDFQFVNPSVFEQFNLESTRSILQTKDSLLWLDSYSVVGVWNMTDNSFQVLQSDGVIKGLRKWNNEGILLFGDFGIQKLQYNSEKGHFSVVSISNEPCYALTGTDEMLYAIFEHGIHSIDSKLTIADRLVDFSSTPFADFNKNDIIDFAVSDGTYWIGGEGFFIRFYPENDVMKFHKFENDPLNDYSFKGHVVRRIRVDELGNLWIGTGKNGLLHLNRQRNQFKHYSWNIEAIADPESNPVRAICKTGKGNLLLGFDVEGVAVLQPNSHFKFYRNYLTADNTWQSIRNVRVIFEDSKGNIWIGVSNNLCIYNEQKDCFESVDCRFSWSWPYRCYVIKEFDLGMVTITSPENVGMVNLKDASLTTIPVKLKNSTISQTVRDIVQDKYRNLWLAQDNVGLLKIGYPDLNYEFFQSATEGLTDDKIYCMHASGDSLWIGANGGLNLLNLKTGLVQKKFFEEDGLSNNIIYSIYEDDDRQLWMSTNKGVTCLDLKSSGFKTYLPTDYFMDDAHFVSSDGTIYYGGYTGVVSFKPEHIKRNTESITPYIESFAVFSQVIYPGDTVDGRVILKEELGQTKQISLSYKQHTVNIGFNAYPFDYPNNHQFRYKLVNYHDDWITSNNARVATFTKLPPGNYTFELQVAPSYNQFGTSVKLGIKIVPPFWMTNLFRISLIVILFVLVWALFQLRIRQVQQRAVLLEQKVNEQTKQIREISEKLHEADQLKLRFFTNISHEFRTPLTLILGNLETLSADSKLAIRSIRKNALRLLKLVNQLIDLRKLDQEQLKLAVSKFELNAFVKEIIESFSALVQQRQITIHFQSNTNQLWVWLDMDKTEKILYNLISNAIKYSDGGKSVAVEIEENNSDVKMYVSDQGVGIAEEELSLIFDRFYRSGESQIMADGHGIGLSLVKGLTEVQQGNIEVQSEKGRGSRFIVSFKKGNNHFNPDDFGDNLIERIEEEPEPESIPKFVDRIGSKSILVVEDHVELAQFIEQSLSPVYKVRTAENGKAAMEMLTDDLPDLIISDVMMPLMDGIQFCAEVKNSIESSHIPFILLSAKTDVPSQITGLETGADDYIEKPFHIKVLVAKINSLLTNRELLKRRFKTSVYEPNLDEQLTGKDKEFLMKVNEIIEDQIANASFSIELLSEHLNMSRATFYRKFSGLTGIKPADYIRRFRLKRAYELFSNTSKSTQEVCDMVGFQSISNFRKGFKDEFGVPPSVVQKS